MFRFLSGVLAGCYAVCTVLIFTGALVPSMTAVGLIYAIAALHFLEKAIS